MLGTGLPVSMYKAKTPIDNWRFNVTQLKKKCLHVLLKTDINYFILFVSTHRQLLL